jgi:O-antigen/teichoic acid export membrane protein
MDKNFVRKFLKGSLSTTLGTMSTIVFHFLSISLMSRYASKEILGLYFLILALAYAGKIITSLGLDLSLVQFLVSEEVDVQREAFAMVIWTRILSMIALTLIVYLLGPFILPLFDAQLVAYQWYLPVLFALMSFRELFFYIMQGLHQFKLYAIIQTLSAIVKFSLVVLFRDSLDLTMLLHIELAMLAISLIFQLCFLPLRRLSPDRFLFKRTIIPKILRFSFPLYTNSLLTYVSDFGGVYIVGLFLSPISIAAYEIAKKIPEGFSRLFTAFHVVYFPNLSSLFAQKDLINAEKFLNKCMTLLSVAAFAVILGSLLFSYELILVVAPDYLEVQPAFVLIMLAVCLHLFANTMGYSLVSASLPEYSTRVNMVSMGLELFLSLMLVPLMGYIGVAVAYVIMTLISQAMAYYYLRQHAKIYINLQEFLKPWLIFAALAAIYLIIGNQAFIWRVGLLISYLALCILWVSDLRQSLPYLWKLPQEFNR